MFNSRKKIRPGPALATICLNQEAVKARQRQSELVRKAKAMAQEIKERYRRPARPRDTPEVPGRRPTRPIPVARQLDKVPPPPAESDLGGITPPGTPPRPITPGRDFEWPVPSLPTVTGEDVEGRRALRVGGAVIFTIRPRIGRLDKEDPSFSISPPLPAEATLSGRDYRHPAMVVLADEISQYRSRAEWPDTLVSRLRDLRPPGCPAAKAFYLRFMNSKGLVFRVKLP